MAFKSISFAAACATATFLTPVVAMADQFTVKSDVSAVTLYPSGGRITRTATLSLPAGNHELHFLDIPTRHQGEMVAGLETKVSNATLGPIKMRSHLLTKSQALQSDAAQAANAQLEDLRDQLSQKKRAISAIELEVTAAQDTLAFLQGLSGGTDATAEELAATAQMIREQSLAARLAQQDASARAEDAHDTLETLLDAMHEAEANLEKIIGTAAYRQAVTLTVSLDEAAEVDVSFAYDTAAAQWLPSYAAHLDTVEDTLRIDRQMKASQDTGEVWHDIDLSFATERPDRRVAPYYLPEYIRRTFEVREQPTLRKSSVMVAPDLMESEAPMMDLAVSSFAAPVSYGLNLTFEYGAPASLNSGGDEAVEFALAPIALSPEVFLRAVPQLEETAYLIVKDTNDSGAVLLPGEVQLFRDGAFVGTGNIGTIVDGGDLELAFGSVDGVQIQQLIVQRNAGDRGVISRKSQSEDKTRFVVENLTSRAWQIEVIGRKSVSEQEDLVIDWTALPAPDRQDVDGRRGIVAWDIDLQAGASWDATLTEELRWPEGWHLQ